MGAKVTYRNDISGLEMIQVGEHHIQFGGRDGEGFCYACQSFDCLDKLSDEEADALNSAE